MRIIYIWFAAALFMILAMARGTAVAAEAGAVPAVQSAAPQSTVPYALAQVADETLRSALSQYKPDYDTLPRQEQVGAFVNLYRSLNGEAPALTPADAGLNAARTAAMAAPAPFVPRFEPWQDPTWFPERDIGILRFEW